MKLNQQPADGLSQKEVTAQTTDYTAASTGNSGTVKIGKGSDESYTIHLNITDSPVTVISTSGDGSSNVNTPPTGAKKKSTRQAADGKPAGRWYVLAAVLTVLAAIVPLMAIRYTSVFNKNTSN